MLALGGPTPGLECRTGQAKLRPGKAGARLLHSKKGSPPLLAMGHSCFDLDRSAITGTLAPIHSRAFSVSLL